MSSKRILRSVLVAVVAVGLVVGSAGAAAAAPERGEGGQAGWGVSVGEAVEVVWGWLVGTHHDPEPSSVTATPRVANSCAGPPEECGDARGNMDPNG